MKVALLTVPVEIYARSSYERANHGIEVFSTASRADGVLPIMPKIAIVNLVRWMEQSGLRQEDIFFYDVDMLLPSDEEITAWLLRTRPDVIGLSAVVSTCYSQVKRLAMLAKAALPDTVVVMGGSLSASANLVLNKTQVDICVVGDGEIAWVDLLRTCEASGGRPDPEALRAVRGLAFLRNGKLDFTGYGASIPGEQNYFPDYDLLESGLDGKTELLRNYLRPAMGTLYVRADARSAAHAEKHPWLAQLWTTKGCVARCTFCQRSTKGYRVFEAESLDQHLKELRRRFNVGFVHILDENFGSDRNYTKSIAEVFDRNGMLWFASGVRVSSVNADYIQFLKDHGCISLKFGVESGNETIMAVMEKRFSVQQVFEALKLCADRDIYSPLAIMVGMPGETIESAAETGRFVGRLSHMQGINPRHSGVSIFYALPLNGTPLFVYGQQKGVLGTTPDEEERYLLSVSSTGADKLNYINLNGSKFNDLIWWDYVVRFEALREFYRLSTERPLGPPTFLQREVDRSWWAGAKTPLQRIKLGLKELFYSKWAFGTWLVKPLMSLARAAVKAKFAYLRYTFARRGIEYNLFKSWPRIEPLSLPVEEKPKKKSLRIVVNQADLQTGDACYPDTVRKELSVGL